MTVYIGDNYSVSIDDDDNIVITDCKDNAIVIANWYDARSISNVITGMFESRYKLIDDEWVPRNEKSS